VLLDNGAFNKAKDLNFPNNILRILPPYTPELNQAECILWNNKRAFTDKLFKLLDQDSDTLSSITNSLFKESVKSICNCDYLSTCQYWTILN
jgi:transposase